MSQFWDDKAVTGDDDLFEDLPAAEAVVEDEVVTEEADK